MTMMEMQYQEAQFGDLCPLETRKSESARGSASAKIRFWNPNQLTVTVAVIMGRNLSTSSLPYLSVTSMFHPYLESPRFLPRRQKKSSVEPPPYLTIAFPTRSPAWKNPSRTNVWSAFFNLPRPWSGVERHSPHNFKKM